MRPPERTVKEQGRSSLTSWKPGQSGNPAGRPIGSRNKLGQALTDALLADFEAHGVAAIQEMREKDPGAYVRVIAGILPKEFTVLPAEDLNDDELDQRIRELAKGLNLQVGAVGAARGTNGKGAKGSDTAKPH